MQVKYKICVYTPTGTKIAEIVHFRTLVIVHQVNSNGYCSIFLDGDDPNVSAFVGRDYIVEVYRSVPDLGIDWYLEFEGLYRTGTHQSYSNGTDTFAAYSLGYLDLLRRRIIAYYSGSVYADTSGPADDVMKFFVRWNATASATAPPRLSDGIIPGFTYAPYVSACANWSGSRAFRNLLEVLQDMSKETNCFFDVVGQTPGNPGSFIFWTYPEVRGQDRRQRNINPITGKNDAGNYPVVFDTKIGNAYASVLSEKTSEEANVVFGLGQGEKGSRMISIVKDTDNINLTPWNRSEIARNATAEKTLAGVTAVAQSALEELMATTLLTFEVNPIPSCQYGRDYSWGDFVTGRYKDVEQHSYILGTTITVDVEQKETIRLDLGTIPK